MSIWNRGSRKAADLTENSDSRRKSEGAPPLAFGIHQRPEMLLFALGRMWQDLMTRNLQYTKEEIRKMIAEILKMEGACTQEESVQLIFEIVSRMQDETAKHGMQVGEYSRILATEMGMSADKAEQLRLAGMLHDLGKIVIPADIVEKPGKLSPEEYEIVKQHVIYGYDFLCGASGGILRLAAQVALEHHERWDGGGYLGKKGNDICLEARIVSVADVFDALISERCYKRPWPPEKARDEIIQLGGTQFDPAITRALEHCFEQIFETIPSVRL